MHTLHLVIEHQSSVHYGMPLRFLNYSNLLYQRRYRDRTNWRKGDTAEPVLHVVVYNGERRWDAPLTLAGLLAGRPQDRPAPLAEKWGVALPSIREYEEASAVLLEKIDRWGEEILERGIKQGIEREKALAAPPG